MSYMEAWRWIVSNWCVPAWQGVPERVRVVIGLDARLGMCNGSLVTQNGAKGMNEFVNRMNSKRNT